MLARLEQFKTFVRTASSALAFAYLGLMTVSHPKIPVKGMPAK
jgi:hypothetical protein